MKAPQKIVFSITVFFLMFLPLFFNSCAETGTIFKTESTTTVGNPMLEFQLGPYVAEPSFQGAKLCVDAVETIGDKALRIDILDQSLVLAPGGTKVATLQVPKGNY